MYSIPYSHDFHSNWIGVGLFSQSDQTKKFNDMYYGKEHNFQRKDFYNDGSPVTFKGDKFMVKGTCGTDHQPTIRVCKTFKN